MRAVLLAAAALSLASPAAGAGRLTEFPTPTTSSGPYGIALGPDGYLWVTENVANQIARVAPNGTMTELPVVTASSGPMGITLGGDGLLYFAENASSKIGGITSLTAPIGPEHGTPTASSHPMHLIAGPDGAVYFTENAGSQVGRIMPAGTITEKPGAGAFGGQPWGLFASPGGLVYTEYVDDIASQWLVGSNNTENPVVLTAGSHPTGGAFGTDGSYWVVESGTNKIWRKQGGSVQEYSIPTAASGAGQMIAGRSGDVWFVETTAGKLAHVSSGGVITEYTLAAGASPQDLAWGPDGAIWITENGTSSVARFVPSLGGDVNGDALVDVSDVFYLINYLFAGGPAPK